MSKLSKNIATTQRQVDKAKSDCLAANGWKYCMWRFYWVFRKQVHDADFICFNIDDAMRAEQCLQDSADSSHAKPKEPAQ